MTVKEVRGAPAGAGSAAAPLVDLVAGARPNFVKLAPVVRAIRKQGRLAYRVVHTGQHYDAAMSDSFFEQLDLPAPDVHLDVGSGTQAAQTGRILERYEAHLLAGRPAATVVFGDVNSTVACALAAVKLQVPVAHVEAGLRSFDRTMPEEINRLLTDAVADLLLVTEPSGLANLEREGLPSSKVRLVGNVMIDTLRAHLPAARGSGIASRLGLNGSPYGFVTLHRPSNVDRPETLAPLLELLGELARERPLVFAVHPRTRAAARAAGLLELIRPGRPDLICVDPLPYLDALALVAGASAVITDSGGLQEETSVLGVPCLTLRRNTERPITVELGTSRLVGSEPAAIRAAFRQVLAGEWPPGRSIPLWDGAAGERIADALASWLVPAPLPCPAA
ncbi:MAG: UDP-N-acetylglucosamine 2-epimerase (non-hydrolyzing) [Acidobacteria bacterium]|nr:UDP-N-acetylglucosamine 2-epimerase (non-hydrolyzing) [Acidobacteriota bacterium]